jgi:hypothetical protein
MDTRQHAFVVMPFGTKTDADGREFPFNEVHKRLIRPALEKAGLKAFRADEELARRIVSPVYTLLPNLEEPQWKKLRVGGMCEHRDSFDNWRRRLEQARRLDLLGDMLVLADEAPVAALRGEGLLTAGKALRKADRFALALEPCSKAGRSWRRIPSPGPTCCAPPTIPSWRCWPGRCASPPGPAASGMTRIPSSPSPPWPPWASARRWSIPPSPPSTRCSYASSPAGAVVQRSWIPTRGGVRR